MKRGSIITWEQVRVVAVALVSFAILLFGGYRLGKAANLFSDRYELVAFVANANGLKPGGAVTVAGQLAGTVEAIEFLPVDGDTTRNLRIVVTVNEQLKEQIRTDSRAKLRTQGLLGDKVFDISPGTLRAAVLSAGDTLVVAPGLDYDEIVATASGAVGDVVALTGDLRGITGGIVEGKGTVGQLVTNRQLYDQLNGTLGETQSLLRRMQSSRGTLGRFIDDPTLYQNLTRATASLDSLASSVARSEGTVGKLLRDDSLYVRLVGITSGADSLVKLLSGGNGIVPKLISDQQMYDQLNKTLTDLNAILEDVRKNPGKYTKGLIKVF